MSGTTPNAPLLSAFGRQPRLSDRVAEDIITTIVARRLRPGDALPTERELGEQFGVSRTVIREAVRALDARGLVEVRVGSRIKVATVDPQTVRDGLWHFVRTSALDAGALAWVRDALDASAARAAALHATSHEIELIDRAAARVGAGAPDAEPAFRRVVRTASHNELLCVLADAVAALPGQASSSAGMFDAARAAAAIARRDPDAAERAMRDEREQPASSDT
ncbi:MAG TPA: GntR family transcriptional regulator [Solirubrobacteraceae bacterium]|nr:GntR family transcriptional regulator [Solirubrobacteraceae bacterium]